MNMHANVLYMKIAFFPQFFLFVVVIYFLLFICCCYLFVVICLSLLFVVIFLVVLCRSAVLARREGNITKTMNILQDIIRSAYSMLCICTHKFGTRECPSNMCIGLTHSLRWWMAKKQKHSYLNLWLLLGSLNGGFSRCYSQKTSSVPSFTRY